MDKNLRVLIGIKSCKRDLEDGCHTAIRETWGKDLPPWATLKFFVGGDTPPPVMEKDEVYLPVKDTYWEGQSEKSQAIATAAVVNGYDFAYLCDTDSMIIPSRWVNCGFEKWDYSGKFTAFGPIGKPLGYITDHFGKKIDPSYAYASGLGYFLSVKAATIISNHPIDHWSEDLWTGQVLGPHICKGEITAADLGSIYEHYAVFHFGCGFFNGHTERLCPAQMMRERYKEFQ